MIYVGTADGAENCGCLPDFHAVYIDPPSLTLEGGTLEPGPTDFDGDGFDEGSGHYGITLDGGSVDAEHHGVGADPLAAAANRGHTVESTPSKSKGGTALSRRRGALGGADGDNEPCRGAGEVYVLVSNWPARRRDARDQLLALGSGGPMCFCGSRAHISKLSIMLRSRSSDSESSTMTASSLARARCSRHLHRADGCLEHVGDLGHGHLFPARESDAPPTDSPFRRSGATRRATFGSDRR